MCVYIGGSVYIINLQPISRMAYMVLGIRLGIVGIREICIDESKTVT